MAATLDEQKALRQTHSETLVLGTIRMDSSYPAGGEAIDAVGDVGYHHFLAGATGGYVPVWDKANQKLMVFQQSAATGALTEVPAATDLSAVAFEYVAFRIG